MEKDLKEFLFNTKPVDLIISLRRQNTGNYASSLSRQIDSTYSHTVKMLHKMEDKFNLVKSEKKGRKKIFTLTPHGEKVSEKLDDLVETVEE